VKPLTITDVAAVLERAWNAALPGKETCERDGVLRELQRLHLPAPVKPLHLRLVK
jgi:hypothetical protein